MVCTTKYNLEKITVLSISKAYINKHIINDTRQISI